MGIPGNWTAVLVQKRYLVYLWLQTVKETYAQMINLILAHEISHFMQQVCLAQAQECILEKSMLDNRKATIIGE